MTRPVARSARPQGSADRGQITAAVRVVLVGATASGKSAVALAAASAHPGTELISVDAMQVYRGMDIGTAKATPSERASVVHHLIDLVSHTEPFTVADYQDALVRVADDVVDRDARAIAVGGTGLHLRSVVDGLQLPGRWPGIRRELEESGDVAALHARLADLDPVAAGRMEPSNGRRVVRALEVCLGSGRRFSDFGPGLASYPPTGITQIGIRWDRTAITRRIEQRVREMIDLGWLAEIGRLRELGPMSATASQALGYRELADHLEGRCRLETAIETTVLRTRQFAVHQDRWFRRDPRIRWIDVQADPVAECLPIVEELLEP